jgi:hypothetical protein
MPYRINKWNGNELTVLEDGRINATTSVKLVGRNYAGYGEVQNENFLWLLENFAADSAPSTPLTGQIYYNTASKILNVYDGADWNPVSAALVADNPPTTPAQGDLWVKQSSKQLFFYDGTTPYNVNGWQLVGPESADIPFGITRLVSARVRDQAGNFHAIIKMTVNGDVLAILSSDIFTINPLDAIIGFSSLTRGFNLSTTANFSANINGNSGTATKLQVPRKINGVNFDGTADINVTASLAKALSRGTYLTGTATSFNGTSDVTFSVDATDANTGGKIVARDISGNFSAGQITAASFVGSLTGDLTGDIKASNGTVVLDSGTTGTNATFVGSVTGNLSGNAGTASKLLVSRTINGVSFDGTQNITITAGNAAGLTAGSYIEVIRSGAPGVYDGTTAETWNIKGSTDSLPNTLVARNAQSDIFAREITASQGFKGNADSADKLKTARAINGVNFDGTANITVFDNTKLPTSGGILSGYLTLHQDPVNNYHAATKLYVDSLYVAKAGSTMTGLLVLAGGPTVDLHAATKKYVDDEVKDVQDAVNAVVTTINNNTFTYGTTMAVGYTNSVGSFSNSSNYFDVFPPTGKTMAKLIGFIPSIAYIYFAGDVNGDDNMRCIWSNLGDRIRVYVQNTEQRSTPSANWLAIWGS